MIMEDAGMKAVLELNSGSRESIVCNDESIAASSKEPMARAREGVVLDAESFNDVHPIMGFDAVKTCILKMDMCYRYITGSDEDTNVTRVFNRTIPYSDIGCIDEDRRISECTYNSRGLVFSHEYYRVVYAKVLVIG